jgi:hypothetical protein
VTTHPRSRAVLSIEDDRGRRVSLQDEGHTSWRYRSPFLEARVQVRKTTGWGLLAFIAPVVAMMIAATAVSAYRRGIASASTSYIASGVFTMGVLAVVWVLRVRLRRPRLLREMIDLGRSDCRCSACTYDLIACAAQDDGCRVCPECGGAWRITPEAAASAANTVSRQPAATN